MPRERSDRVSIVSSARGCQLREHGGQPARTIGRRASGPAADSPPARRGAAGRRRGCPAPAAAAPRPGRRRSARATRCSSAARCELSSSRTASSARRRTERSTSPAWAASPVNSFSSTGVSGCPIVLLHDEDARASRPRGALRAHGGHAERRWRRPGRAARRRGRRRAARSRPGTSPPSHAEPHLRVAGAGRLREQPGHPRRDLVRGVCAGHLLGEPGEHLVRRRPFAARRAGRQPAVAAGVPARTRARRSRWRARTARGCGESVRPSSAPPPRTTAT